jgi:hypothetical protein
MYLESKQEKKVHRRMQNAFMWTFHFSGSDCQTVASPYTADDATSRYTELLK